MASPVQLDLDDLPLLVTAVGQIVRHSSSVAASSAAVLPGSFNPVHSGHWELASAAQRLLGGSVAFELSIANVDKPALSHAEVMRRVAQFAGRGDVWVTRAPRFMHKAALFPGATFVVGTDTALRLVDTRYYGHDRQSMLDALRTLKVRGCRVLVAARCDRGGALQTLADVPVPSGFDDLFIPIAVGDFRCDLSSTELRCNQSWTSADTGAANIQ